MNLQTQQFMKNLNNIGDSRIYRIRKDTMKKVTTDHSYVEKLIQDGDITREESYSHPKKNLLTKALGTDEEVKPDLLYTVFNKNDVILEITEDAIKNENFEWAAKLRDIYLQI